MKKQHGFVDIWLALAIFAVLIVGAFLFLQYRSSLLTQQKEERITNLKTTVNQLETATTEALSNYGDIVSVSSEVICREKYNGFWPEGTSCRGYIYIKSDELYVSDAEPPNLSKRELADILDMVVIEQLDIKDSSQVDTGGYYKGGIYSIDRFPSSFDGPVEPLESADNPKYKVGELNPAAEYLYGGLVLTLPN